MSRVIKIKPRDTDLLRVAGGIVKTLRDKGYEAYCVGGCAREMVMGKTPGEYDITTSATPEQVARLFPRTVPIGASFGVMLVIMEDLQFEVATFRKDESYTDGRHPDNVTYSKDVKEDVLRRDFTINGMLYDPEQHEIIDYTDGLDDIEEGVLRAIGEPYLRFSEDKLRMMRAVRFSSRYGFKIEEKTYEAILELAPQIIQVSEERIRDELVKIISQQNPGAGLSLLSESGLLRHILPEVEEMHGVEQPPQFHPEGDVFIHTCLVLDRLYENTNGNVPPELALGALLHDVGKPPTFSVSDRIRFNAHDRVGADMSKSISRKLKLSNKQAETIYELIREHLKFKDVFKMRKSTLKRFMGMDEFDLHMELHLADCEASHGSRAAYDFILEKLEELSEEEIRPKPLIGGKELIDMGYKPGPLFSEILSIVEEAQLEGDITTSEEACELVSVKYPRGD